MTQIRSVEAIPIGYPEPNDGGRNRYVCLVKVTSDAGAIGWGEATTYWPEASAAAAVLIAKLGELLVGRDPVDISTLWDDLHQETWWYGNGGIASMAIAGLDIALWDLKGKLLGVSVLELLGGPVKKELPGIASGHAVKADLGELAAEGAEWLAGGLHGLKVGFGKKGEARLGYDPGRDVEYVRRLREAIGPDKLIMIDIGAALRWDVGEALARIRAFEEFDLHWIEEPLGHWDPPGYAQLRERVTTRIAYGEREYGLEGIERILATGTCDVVGIDPGRAGITAFANAVRRIGAAGAEANAHAWSTAIVTAASLAISWSTEVCGQFEVKPFPDVVQTELVENPLKHVDGWLPLPEGPGLGIVVSEPVVERLRVDR